MIDVSGYKEGCASCCRFVASVWLGDHRECLFSHGKGSIYNIVSIRVKSPLCCPAFLSFIGCDQRKILFSSWTGVLRQRQGKSNCVPRFWVFRCPAL